MRSLLGRPATRVDAAVQYAARAHAGQKRKDGRTPYIVHPVAVLRYLSSELGVTDPTLLCAAVLHDTIEDTDTSFALLSRRFGRRTARIVQELTVPSEFHGPKVPDARKTEVMLRAVDRISWGAILVKLADRWDNVADMTNAQWGSAKRQRYLAQSGQLLAAVHHRWARSPPPKGLVVALKKAVKDVRAYLNH